MFLQLCQNFYTFSFLYWQVLVREYNGLQKVASFIKSNSQNVKLQALNVINNLAMDVENQRFLKVCYRLPNLELFE